MTRRPILLSMALGLLGAAAFGCGGADRRFLAPHQAMLCGGVNVTFQRAEADDDSLLVKLHVTNLSDQPMMVNRDGFGLRLPTGQVLPRRGFNQTPYRLLPGRGHDVWVRFEEDGFRPNQLANASVIVGGISYANDPIARIAGEIPLSAIAIAQ